MSNEIVTITSSISSISSSSSSSWSSSSITITTIEDSQSLKLSTISERTPSKTITKTPTLFKLIRKSKWKEVIDYIDTNSYHNRQKQRLTEEIKYKNSGGNTLLHYACYRNPPFIIIQKIVKLMIMTALCNCKDNTNSVIQYEVNNNNCTALHIGCIYGISDNILELLLQHASLSTLGSKNNEGATILHNACWKKLHTSMLRIILKYDTNIVNTTSLTNSKEMHGLTPLHVLLWNNPTIYQLQLLLQYDMDHHNDIHNEDSSNNDIFIEQSYDEYATPLHFAIKYSPRLDIMQLLTLSTKGKQAIIMVNKYNATPLHVLLSSSSSSSCTTNIEELCKLLVYSNTKVTSVQDCTGATPLHLSCCYNTISINIIKILLKNSHSNVRNIQDKSGNTPLSLFLSTYIHSFDNNNNASTSTSSPSLKDILQMIRLLSTRDNLKLVDGHGNTPLSYACMSLNLTNPYSEQIINYIYSEYPSSIKIKNKNGRTPLHLLFSNISSNFSLDRRIVPDGIYLSSKILLNIISCSDDDDDSVLSIQDLSGNTPLHHVIECCNSNIISYGTLQVLITQLEEENNTIFNCKNKDGYTPYTLFWKLFLPVFVKYYNTKSSDTDDSIIDMNEIPFQFWKKIQLLLLHASNPAYYSSSSSSSIVHAACAVPTPNIFIQALVQLYPQCITQKDDLGRVPLHYAAMSAIHHDDSIMTIDNDHDDDEEDDIILQHRATSSFDYTTTINYYNMNDNNNNEDQNDEDRNDDDDDEHNIDDDIDNMRIRLSARRATANALLSITSSDIASFDFYNNDDDDDNTDNDLFRRANTDDSIIQRDTTATTETTIYNNNNSTTTKTVIDTLLQINKSTAFIKDNDGYLPFMLGCLHSSSLISTGLYNLLYTNPNVIEMNDNCMNMFPFMLAAVNQKKDDNNDLERLDFIYQLLLHSPTLIMS